MKIALLTKNNAVYESSFSAIAELLLKKNHEVAAFYSPGDLPPQNPQIRFCPCSWWNFEWLSLLSYKPDRIIIFNGSFVWANASIQILKTLFPCYYAELGWLPQANHMYIDPEGPGGRSKLSNTMWVGRPDSELCKTMDAIKFYYPEKPKHKDMPGEYILIPLQIEDDTSILYDSPLFKTMESLIGFVHWHFSDYPIIVKPHPLSKKTHKLPTENVKWAPKEASFCELAQHAKAIIGINSTCLIESLVFNKPVGALGKSVATNKGVMYDGKKLLMTPRGLLTFNPDPFEIKNCLNQLYKAQFNRECPPETLIELLHLV
jgi:hypothetical protein